MAKMTKQKYATLKKMRNIKMLMQSIYFDLLVDKITKTYFLNSFMEILIINNYCIPLLTKSRYKLNWMEHNYR